MFKNIFKITFILLLITTKAMAAHKHLEAAYQNAWCKSHNGITEYRNKDSTRVDCLTDTHAVEFDFASKWAESVGQALHYEIKTGKKAMVVLILENPQKEICYYRYVQELAKKYNFDCEYVTEKILTLDNKGHCNYKPCKCNK